MSMLGFLFKDRQDKKTAVEDVVPEPTHPSSAPSPVAPPAPPAAQVDAVETGEDLNFDEIRCALDQIAEVLGRGDGYEMLKTTGGNVTAVELELSQLIQAMPAAFREDVVSPADRKSKVSVLVEDIFSQLSQGRITTSVNNLIADVPTGLLSADIDNLRQDAVSLPLSMIVGSINPEELRKRTTNVEGQQDLDEFPNLFTPTESRSVPEPDPNSFVDEITPIPRESDDIQTSAAPSAWSEQPAATTEPPVVKDIVSEPEPVAPESTPELDTPEEIAPEPEEAVEEETISEPPTLLDEVVSEPEPAEPEVTPLRQPANAFVSEEEQAPVVEEPVEETVEPVEETVEPIAETVEPVTAETEAPVETPEPPPLAFEAEEDIPEQEEESPVAKPDWVGSVPEPTPAIEPEPVEPIAEPQPAAAALSAPEPAAADAADDTANRSEPMVMLHGLNLNTADVGELLRRVDGIGSKLAERIVYDRDTQGPYLDIHDLARVPGLGRKTFERVTGLSWLEGEEILSETLSHVLAFTSAGYLNVKDVTRRFAELPGFDGCVLAHQDGHVLASTWDHDRQQALGAFAPQIFKKIDRYIGQLRLGNMDCLTTLLDQRPFTFVQCEDIYFIAVHRFGGISRKHIRLAHGVGSRVGKLLKQKSLTES